MTEIFKFIFERLTEPLGLPVSPIWEFVILAAISFVAFKIAFSFVGKLYAFDMIDGSFSGSAIHWIIRLIIFALIWAVLYFTIIVVRFVKAHLLLSVCIVAGIVLLVLFMKNIFQTMHKNTGE